MLLWARYTLSPLKGSWRREKLYKLAVGKFGEQDLFLWGSFPSLYSFIFRCTQSAFLDRPAWATDHLRLCPTSQACKATRCPIILELKCLVDAHTERSPGLVFRCFGFQTFLVKIMRIKSNGIQCTKVLYGLLNAIWYRCEVVIVFLFAILRSLTQVT